MTLYPVTIELAVGDNVAIACVNQHGVTYTGEAKRAPGDPRNPGIGRDLAIARCLQSYGKALEEKTLRLSNALSGSSVPATTASGSASQQGGSESLLVAAALDAGRV